jgi:hypothetical protein
VTEEQISVVLRDVVAVAYKDRTPPSARLLHSPGRRAGEESDFMQSYLIKYDAQRSRVPRANFM